MRLKSERIEFRTSPADRALFVRAVEASGCADLTEFAESNLRLAAHRVLADRTEFVLTADAWRAWKAVNERPARSVEGLRELMARPSPFAE